MRYLIVFVMIVSLSSFTWSQEKNKEEVPIRDVFPTSYENTNDLKIIFDKAAVFLKDSPEVKIYVVFYRGLNRNKSNFNSFKLKIEKILVKSNQIPKERVSIIDSGIDYYPSNSFESWFIDKDGKPIY